MYNKDVSSSPLGKKQAYISSYKPDLLFPLPRINKRQEIGINKALPFKGVDIWNAFELSWLNKKGKPEIAIAEFHIPCESSNLIESKSFKLYLNSFNQTSIDSIDTVKSILKKDLSEKTESDVNVIIHSVHSITHTSIGNFKGQCLDQLDINCDTYQPKPNYLTSDQSNVVSEIIYSDLLKSNCLVTGQPDWGSVQISYKGPKINREGLLKYIISFRDHNEFHEQCVERIFMDIISRCQCTKLTVYARYTRRGGLDINPIRSTDSIDKLCNIRHARQ